MHMYIIRNDITQLSALDQHWYRALKCSNLLTLNCPLKEQKFDNRPPIKAFRFSIGFARRQHSLKEAHDHRTSIRAWHIGLDHGRCT